MLGFSVEDEEPSGISSGVKINRMQNYRLPRVVWAILGLIVHCYGQASPIAVWEDLKSLAVISATDRTHLRSSYCPDGCGFDRTSEGDTRFLRIVGDEAVIFESFNPGAIVRVWMTMGFGTSTPLNENVRLRLYLDDLTTPAIDVSLPDFFDGADPRWPLPMANNREASSGGNYNYRPFVFQQRARISLVNAEDQRIWFQVHHRQFPADQIPELITQSQLDEFQSFLGGPESDSELTLSGTTELNSGQTGVIPVSGPGWVVETLLRTDAALDELDLRWVFDGSASEWIPATLYFALGDPGAINTSRMMGRTVPGTLYDHFPKPFFANAKLELRNMSTQAVVVEHSIRHDSERPPADTGKFGYQRRATCPSTVGLDIELLALRGAGRWVGLFQSMDSFERTERTYLEGDEHVIVDDMIHPLWHGTGVEDFYAGGFYFDSGPFTAPFHGSTFHTISAERRDATGMVRFMVTDSLPFRESIRVGQEVGRRNDIQACSDSVAYYYLRPATKTIVSQLDMSPSSREEHGFIAAADETCELVSSCFVDNPETCTDLPICSFTGDARFTLTWPNPSESALLIRTFNAVTGGGKIAIRFDDTVIGTLGPHAPNAARRFAQDSIIVPSRPDVDGPVVVEVTITGESVSLGGLELRSSAPQTIHSDGFESTD